MTKWVHRHYMRGEGETIYYIHHRMTDSGIMFPVYYDIDRDLYLTEDDYGHEEIAEIESDLVYIVCGRGWMDDHCGFHLR